MKQAGSKQPGKQQVSIPPAGTASQQPRLSQPQPSPYAPTAAVPMPAPSHEGRAQSQNPPKVAIPRLHRNSENHSLPKGSATADKNRVAHACEPCRQRKTKCSGERPVCQHCEDFKLMCLYADGKRDRTKKWVLIRSNVSWLTSVIIDNLVVWPAGLKSTSSFSKSSACVLDWKTKP